MGLLRYESHSAAAASQENFFDAAYWWATEVESYKGLLSGRSWVGPAGQAPKATPVFLTYSFQKRMTDADDDAWTGNHARWRPFSNQDKVDAKAALRQWGAASGITFLEVKGDHGDIQFSWFPQKDSSGLGYYPWGYGTTDDWDYVSEYTELSGNIYLNVDERDRFAREPAFKTYVLLHEIGHALGLKHSFDTLPYNNRVLTDQYDDVSHTVMAYLKDYQASPTTLGHLDIEAIRKLYGSPRSDGKQVAKWHWDKKNEVLTQIGKSSSDVVWGTNVTDKLYGERGNDRLHGFAGDDLLVGGIGNDILIGGLGRDSFRFDIDPALDPSVDVVSDFDPNLDKIELSASAFKDIGAAGQLAPGRLAIGTITTKTPKDVRIVFDMEHLFYDPDGGGPAAPIMIAWLKLTDDELTINASHFLVI